MIKILEKYIKIDSKNNSLIIEKTNNLANLVYYGKKLKDNKDYSIFSNPNRDNFLGAIDDYSDTSTIMSSTGDACNKSSYVSFFQENGLFINRFQFCEATIIDDFETCLVKPRNIFQTIKLKYIDSISKVVLNQYFSIYENSDIISVHSEITNTLNKPIIVNNLMSCQLEFFSDQAEITTFDGTWLKERTRHTTSLNAGRFEIDSKVGVSSGNHNPFILVKINENLIGLNLIYSGNHKEIVEVSPYRKVRILTGMNNYNLNYKLNPNEILISPEAIFLCESKEEEITQELHNFSLNHIINPNFAYKPRPVLLNSWEGTYFNFTGNKILEMAKISKEVGIEMLVLDDGWFGNRNDDTTSLGDWFDNTEKTGGLKNLVKQVKSMGLKFGIWVEPEMISQNSLLFKNNPEFAMAIPNVSPIERRNQLMIDLVNPDVQNYLIKTLTNLLKDIDVDYVKWDHNRFMIDIYSSKLDFQGKYFYDYYKAQINILNQITKNLPNVLFESCSSGGNRFDLQMQYFMPQNWGSDNTNAFDRLTIQEGTLVAYPQSSMGSHISESPLLPSVSFETRFNIACVGAFGYEFDITTASKEKLEIIKNQIEYYKKHRDLLQYGNYYKLGQGIVNNNVGGYMFVSKNKEEAIAVIFDKSAQSNTCYSHFMFKGLDENTLYKVEMRKQSNIDEILSFEAYGDALNNYGLDFKNILWHENDRFYNSTFSSRMFYISKIK